MPRNWSLSQCSMRAMRGSWLVSRTKSELKPQSLISCTCIFPFSSYRKSLMRSIFVLTTLQCSAAAVAILQSAF